LIVFNDSFSKYSGRGAALFTRIPISELECFKKWIGVRGVVKIRYRGPRFNVPSARSRSGLSKQSTCLKQDATHFSVYRI